MKRYSSRQPFLRCYIKTNVMPILQGVPKVKLWFPAIELSSIVIDALNKSHNSQIFFNVQSGAFNFVNQIQILYPIMTVAQKSFQLIIQIQTSMMFKLQHFNLFSAYSGGSHTLFQVFRLFPSGQITPEWLHRQD